jgi:hypothetical protein
MRTPCSLSVYPSVSVHLSVYSPKFFRLMRSVCVPPSLIFEAYEITLLFVSIPLIVARQRAFCVPPLIISFSMRSVSYQRKVGN